MTMVAGPGVAGASGRIARMIHPVEARSERDAIAQCKASRPGSFGHWISTKEFHRATKETS
jgi:hypothetical protein